MALDVVITKLVSRQIGLGTTCTMVNENQVATDQPASWLAPVVNRFRSAAAVGQRQVSRGVLPQQVFDATENI